MTSANFPPDYVNYNNGGIVFRSTVAMSTLATFIVCLRLWARKGKGNNLALDDWLIVASLPFLYATMMCAVLGVYYGGVGRHLAVIMMTEPKLLNNSLLGLFVAESVYATVISLVKASMLAMYHRIFPTPFMNRAGYILGAVVFMWWAAVCIGSWVQCQPVQKAWYPSMEGKCFDTNMYLLSNAIPNIITDISILCLPMYEVYRLQVPRLQKSGLSGIFLLGGFVVVISFIRLKAVIDMTTTEQPDLTVLLGPSWIWTVAEPAVGIICACLPTMQPLTRLLFGKFFSTRPSREITKTIVTIGGRVFKPSKPSKKEDRNGTGSFERLRTVELGEPVFANMLLPRGYSTEREITVNGKRTPSQGSLDLPVERISVRKETTWKVSKASE